MSKTFLTQCPHCTTRFRVNSQQLFVAQGAVRCGSCMQVFNARLSLEQDIEEPPLLPVEPADQYDGNDQLDALQIHDDMDIDLDSPDFEQELARLARMEAEQEPLKQNAPLPDPVFSAAETSDWQLETINPATDEQPLPEDDPPLFAGDSISADEPQPDDSAANWAQNDSHRHEPSLASDELDAIASETLYLEWQPGQRSRHGLLWSMLSLLAALGLVTQYSYYNFDSLARQAYSRPWLERACTVLGCRLPEQVDVSLIASSNLIVRPHADFANALSVDAIIYNRAGFSQPFPLLQLNFTDSARQLVASRTFSPAEYLGGELAGRNSMPAQVPIRIALDVLVPDARASSYNLQFLSPE